MPGFGSGDLLLSSRRDNRPKKGYVPLAAVRRSQQVPSDAFLLEEDERCGVVSRSAASFASHSVGVHPPHVGHVPRGQDVTPLYEEYIQDSRLADAAKAGLN